MKLQKIDKSRFAIISNFINIFTIITCIFSYINNIKLSYFLVIGVLILLLVVNIASLLINVNLKNHVNKMEDKIEMFETIMEAAPNAVSVHRKLNFIYANSKALELFNLKDPLEVVGKPVDSLVKLNVDLLGEEGLRCALREKEFEPITEEMFIMENGKVIELEIFSTPIKIKDRICVLTLCKNVTEKKRIVELEKNILQKEKKLREKIENDKLKDEFFANLSHELRTPLALILGTLQLIEKIQK